MKTSHTRRAVAPGSLNVGLELEVHLKSAGSIFRLQDILLGIRPDEASTV